MEKYRKHSLLLVSTSILISICIGQSMGKNQKGFTPAGSLFPVDSYHGYIPIGKDGADLFYWWFPSQSSPSTDPLVLWLNGGPGASSMCGLLYENGPFLYDEETEKVVINEHSWNQKTNLLFLDQPIGVGYSHAKRDEWPSTQVESSETVLEFFKKFMEIYPEFKDRDIYITGESYAGHYLPFIAKRLKESKNPTFNLRGVAIGNGLTDVRYQHHTYAEFANLPDNVQYTQLTPDRYQQVSQLFKVCQSMLFSESPLVRGLRTFSYCGKVSSMITHYDSGQPKFSPYDIRISGDDMKKGKEGNSKAFRKYMNSPEVLNELQSNKLSVTTPGFHSAMLRRDFVTDCTTPLREVLEAGIRVMIYAGNYDYICNWVGNKDWIDHLQWSGYDEWKNAQREDYHGYGYRWVAKNLQFVVVFNAGHLVPHDQPANSLDMINRFISNID